VSDGSNDLSNTAVIAAISTAVVGVLGLVGGGIRWLLSWAREGSVSRDAKLNKWHEELTEREHAITEQEREFQDRIERRLETLESENAALRQAFTLLSATLRQHDPANPALTRAEAILAAAFPIPLGVPADMVEQLREVDRAKQSRPPRRARGG
jgi:hypothetical protein